MKYVLLSLIYFLWLSGKAQQTDVVDFKQCKADVSFKLDKKSVIGKVSYTFDIHRPVDSIFIDAKNMTFSVALLNNKVFSLHSDGKKVWIKHHFEPSKSNTIYFEFEAVPKKALYFIKKQGDSTIENQIWTQGQGKYTSNWLPSIDDMNDKIEFDLSIAFPKDYEVIANGKLKSKQSLGYSNYDIWHYNMEKPMSSYLVALAIGKYDKYVELSESKIELTQYYYPEDSLKQTSSG